MATKANTPQKRPISVSTPDDQDDSPPENPRALLAKSPEDILAFFGLTQDVIEQGSRAKLPSAKSCAIEVGRFYKKNGRKPKKGDGRIYSMFKKVLVEIKEGGEE